MAHLQVVVLGGSPDGEVWSNSFRFAIGNLATLAPTPGRNDITDAETLQDLADNVAGLNSGNVYPTTLRGGLSDRVHPDPVDVECGAEAGPERRGVDVPCLERRHFVGHGLEGLGVGDVVTARARRH